MRKGRPHASGNGGPRCDEGTERKEVKFQKREEGRSMPRRGGLPRPSAREATRGGVDL